MMLRVRSQILGAILFMIVSFIVILIGTFLSLSIVFAFLGIPILLLGIVLFIFSVFNLLVGIFGDIHTVIKKFKRNRRPKQPGVIDVTEVDGIYQRE
jgi:hypothetical protein